MDVLLVHGLGRTAGSMRRLGRALRREGHDPHYFSYFPWAERDEGIVGRLRSRLQPFRDGALPYALVGHSLGGLLLRRALATGIGRAPAHLILLGTPNRSSRVARRAWRFRPFRWVTRDCGRLLAGGPALDALPLPDCPYVVVAGTRGIYGRWSPFGAEPNDGLVAVSETELGSETAVAVPAAHTFMMNHPAVRRLIREALGGPGGHVPE